jgi:hypothetical protein
MLTGGREGGGDILIKKRIRVLGFCLVLKVPFFFCEDDIRNQIVLTPASAFGRGGVGGTSLFPEILQLR